MQYVKGLNFDEKPDYLYLKSLIRNAFDKKSYTLDYVYDWMINKDNQKDNEEKIQKCDDKEDIRINLESIILNNKTNITIYIILSNIILIHLTY